MLSMPMVVSDWFVQSTRNHSYIHYIHSKAKDWKAKNSLWSPEEFLFRKEGSQFWHVLVCQAGPIPNLNKCDADLT